MEEDKTTNKKLPFMRVSIEFKDFCDRFASKINNAAWNGLNLSYADITRSLTKKLEAWKIA